MTVASLYIIKAPTLSTVITITPMGQNILLDGCNIIDTCKELGKRGIDVIEMNCFRWPATMMP